MQQAQGQEDFQNLKRQQNTDLKRKTSSSFADPQEKTSKVKAQTTRITHMSEVLFIFKCLYQINLFMGIIFYWALINDSTIINLFIFK